jgi:hypothetical protein
LKLLSRSGMGTIRTTNLVANVWALAARRVKGLLFVMARHALGAALVNKRTNLGRNSELK